MADMGAGRGNAVEIGLVEPHAMSQCQPRPQEPETIDILEGGATAAPAADGPSPARLLPHGTDGARRTGYEHGALNEDYRLSALLQIMTPVWQAAIDLPPAIWWSHLERIMLAVDDLGCRDLLT